MDAWELLTENSSAPIGADMWTHLNSQEGGGEVVYILPRDSFGVSTTKVSLAAPTTKTQLGVSTKVVSTVSNVTSTPVTIGVATNVV